MTQEELQTANTLKNQMDAMTSSIEQVDNLAIEAPSDILNVIRTEFEKSEAFDQTTIDSLAALIVAFRTTFSDELKDRRTVIDNTLKALVGTNVPQDSD